MSIIEKFWQEGLIDKPEDLTKFNWTMDSDMLSWNGNNDLDELFNGDGDTYSEMILESPEEFDGYMIVTLSNSCGGSGQCIFDMSKKVEEE